MNRLFNVIYAILMILWLFMLCYLIIIEDWESLIKNISIFSLIVPILFYAVPLFDTSYAIVRRFLNGQSMVERDEDHLHHRLLRQGFTVPQIVILMIGITLVFSVFAIFSQIYHQFRWVFIFLSGGLIVLLTVFMSRLDKK